MTVKHYKVVNADIVSSKERESIPGKFTSCHPSILVTSPFERIGALIVERKCMKTGKSRVWVLRNSQKFFSCRLEVSQMELKGLWIPQTRIIWVYVTEVLKTALGFRTARPS